MANVSVTLRPSVNNSAQSLPADDRDSVAWDKVTGKSLISTTGGLQGGGSLDNDLSLSVADAGITNSKLANMAATTLKGNSTAGTAVPSDLTVTTVSGMMEPSQAVAEAATSAAFLMTPRRVKNQIDARQADQSAAETATNNTNLMTPLQVKNAVQNATFFTQTGTGAAARTIPSKLKEVVSVKDFGAVGDGVTNDSVAIQAAITAVNAAGGGVVFVPHGTYIVENIEIKNLVWIVGEGMQSTRLKLKAGSEYDVLYTTGAYSLFGSGDLSSGANVAPYRWGLFNFTIDGNAPNNTSNARCRGVVSWSIGMTIENVQIINCRRHGLLQGAPLNWTYYNPDWTGECRVQNLTILRCNQSKDPDVAGGIGGGGMYYNGPTDGRFFELFIGWCEGGYSLKIGSSGASRYIGGELWGGGYADNVNISSITRSSTTATVTTSTAHGLATDELVTIYGAVQTDYNITATVTVTGSTTFTYTVAGSPATPATGTMLLNKIYFPQWAVISEASNGFTGTDINLSGGYSGQALIRANGFRHTAKHNYIVAGDGTTARIIQKGYQIGDSANSFTNVAGVYIDALHEDILGPTVDFNSSGGFNRINIRGYCNYSGMSVDIAGAPNVLDEYDIRIGGNTTVYRYAGGLTTQSPATKTGNYTMTAADASLIFNGSGSITLSLQDPALYPGRVLVVKTVAAQTVVSNASNVVPLSGGSAGTAILAATAGKWAMLVSDGTNWVVMAGS